MKKIINILIVLLIFSVDSIAQQVKEKDVPPAIVTTAHSRIKGKDITMWVYDASEKKYVASHFGETSVEIIEISGSNKWLQTTTAILEKDFPAAIIKTLKSTYLDKGYEARNFTRVEEPGGVHYECEVTSEDEGRELIFSPEGKILSAELF